MGGKKCIYIYVCMYVCMHTSNSYGYSQLIITNLDHYEKKVLCCFFFKQICACYL